MSTAPKTTSKTIKAVHTLYGYKGYIGSERVKEFGSDLTFDVLCWLDEMLATGEYKLSEKSTLTMSEVEAHRARMAEPVPHRAAKASSEPIYPPLPRNP